MRTRAVLGLVAGFLLLASAAAHGLLGWPGLRSELIKAGASTDLMGGVGAGWLFGSVAMVVFAVIVVNSAVGLWRGASPAALPALVIGAAYVLFGIASLLLLQPSPPLISFVVVGALSLVYGAWPFTRSAA